MQRKQFEELMRKRGLLVDRLHDSYLDQRVIFAWVAWKKALAPLDAECVRFESTIDSYESVEAALKQAIDWNVEVAKFFNDSTYKEVGYQYKYHDPFSGGFFWSPWEKWNGNQPLATREIFCRSSE